jgi:hypothetical protein
LQVDIPNKEYGGHQPIVAVINGRSPNKPHSDFGPQNNSDKRNSPTISLMIRSILPIFFVIIITSSL